MKPLQTIPDKKLLRKAQRVYNLLETHFGLPEWRQPLPALDELISTILSQNTNDINRDVAFIRLKRQFRSWEAVRDAALKDVVKAIQPAGLANRKAPRIQDILRQISQERGELDLEFLKTMPPEQVRSWLNRFNGVGPKTAAIVMQFALEIPAFPVDTHIYRISGRVGLRPAQMSAEEAHTWMELLYEPRQYGPGHLNLIRLGREVCTARKPHCEKCPLNEICDFYQANQK